MVPQTIMRSVAPQVRPAALVEVAPLMAPFYLRALVSVLSLGPLLALLRALMHSERRGEQVRTFGTLRSDQNTRAIPGPPALGTPAGLRSAPEHCQHPPVPLPAPS